MSTFTPHCFSMFILIERAFRRVGLLVVFYSQPLWHPALARDMLKNQKKKTVVGSQSFARPGPNALNENRCLSPPPGFGGATGRATTNNLNNATPFFRDVCPLIIRYAFPVGPTLLPYVSNANNNIGRTWRCVENAKTAFVYRRLFCFNNSPRTTALKIQ